MNNEEFLLQLKEIRQATLLQSKDVYNVEEACLFLGVKRCYLYELMRNKKVRYFKSRGGKKAYFKRADLEKWMLYVECSTQEETKKKARSYCCV